MMSELQRLSARGERRRQQILDLAVAAARARRRRRVIGRVAIAGLLIAVLVPTLFRDRTATEIQVAVKPIVPHLPAPEARRIVVTRIETDPHIIERLAIHPEPVHVTMINDRELLDDLAQTHHPAALAYVNGKAMLLYR